MIPILGAKGQFKLTVPFDTLIKPTDILEVKSIRSITELNASGENPLDLIYKAVGLTEDEFMIDLNASIPIVVMVTTGNSYIYIPANRITSAPIISGINYQEKILACSVGNLPLDYDFNLVKDTIIQSVMDSTGIEVNIEIVASSKVNRVSDVDDGVLMQLLTNKKSIDKSYKTRFIETQTLYNTLKTKFDNLQNWIKTNCPDKIN